MTKHISVVDALMDKCEWGEKYTNTLRKIEHYHCKNTDIMVMKNNEKWVGKYNATCGITEEEAEELWYRIEPRPLLKGRKDLLKWLGLENEE